MNFPTTFTHQNYYLIFSKNAWKRLIDQRFIEGITKEQVDNADKKGFIGTSSNNIDCYVAREFNNEE